MHSEDGCFCSAEGIEQLVKAEIVNLKCNSLNEITHIVMLKGLRELDISSNLISSLKGIEKCSSL